MIKPISNKWIWCCSIILIIMAFLVVLLSPPVHDYLFYQEDWDSILYNKPRSLDKWNIPIAYGPLYYCLALIYYLNPKLPHLLMVVCWAISSCYILKIFLKNSDKKTIWGIWVLVFMNPLIWFYIIYYGSIDSLLCCLVLFGIVNYDKKKYVNASILIGLGILLKLVPIFIVPFLMIRNNKIENVFAISLACVLCFGFGIGYFIFDIDSITNFLLQANRPSSTLSVFRFLRGDFSPLKLVAHQPNIDHASIYLIIFSLGILLFIHFKYHLNYLISCALSLLLVITFHLVGNHQYYITLVFIVLFLVAKMYQSDKSKKISWFIFPIFISIIPFLELLIRRFFFQLRGTYDELVGLFVFVFSLQLAFFLFRIGFRNSIK